MSEQNEIQKGVPLSIYTTLGIGGPARYFAQVREVDQLIKLIEWSKERNTPFMVIGSGSNLLVSDSGFEGLIIKNNIQGIKAVGAKVVVRSGTKLQELVDFLVSKGLGGLEKLTGIPGTVGGAVYGNAGAYGQTISDCLARLKVYDGKFSRYIERSDCEFEYRESVFKKDKNLVILAAEFSLDRRDSDKLKDISRETLMLRKKKYPDGLKSPGSFFKNLVADELPKEVLQKIPAEKIVYGKVPAGYLLEAVGANSKRKRGVYIASYHGNLFINKGTGTAKDFLLLAEKYRGLVKKKFGVLLETEVQLVGS